MLFYGVTTTSGFFTKPNKVISSSSKEEDIDNNNNNNNSMINGIKYIHSSEYTSSKDYGSNKNIVIIGSSFTSMEIASNLAKETVSSNNKSDANNTIENIYHILPNIPYTLPRNILSESTKSFYLLI